MQTIIDDFKNGQIFIMNAGTVPGLFSSALSSAGVDKIYSLKQRSEDKPFAIFIPDLASISRFVNISHNATEFINNSDLTKSTFLLNANDYALQSFDKRLILHGKIGIRIIVNLSSITQNIILAGTSVNLSGQKPLLFMPKSDEFFGVQVIKSTQECLGEVSKIWDLTDGIKLIR